MTVIWPIAINDAITAHPCGTHHAAFVAVATGGYLLCMLPCVDAGSHIRDVFEMVLLHDFIDRCYMIIRIILYAYFSKPHQCNICWIYGDGHKYILREKSFDDY